MDKKEIEERKRRGNKELDFLEGNIFSFLKQIFENDEVSKEELISKQRLDEDEFNFFKGLMVSKNYIKPLKKSISKKKEFYQITYDGVDYLLKYNKTKIEEKSTKWVKWATIVMAISALVQLIDIWVNKPTTKEAIILFSGNFIGGILTLMAQAVPYALIVGMIIIIFKIIKSIKEKKAKEKFSNNLKNKK
jgi:hypothetical protein